MSERQTNDRDLCVCVCVNENHRESGRKPSIKRCVCVCQSVGVYVHSCEACFGLSQECSMVCVI